MKKLYTFLVLCLMGTMGAWAKTTTLLEYGTSDVAWTDTLVAEWTATGTTATKEDTYVQVSGGNGDNYLAKTISPTANSIINVTAVWRGASSTGRTFAQGNASYFRFGNILVAQNDQDQKHGYGFAGLANLGSVTTFSCGSYRTDIANLGFLLVEMEINTATNTLTSFTVKSEDGSKTYVSQSNVVLTNTDYTTVAFGYKKGGGVKTTNKENLKSILITETTQEVSTAGYTINYMFGDSNVKQVTGTTVVGESINAESPITVDGTKYYTADGATTSLTVSATEANNVLNVALRKAQTKTISLNAVDADGNVLKTFTTECVEGESKKNLYYTRAVEYNGKYYTVPAANAGTVNYGKEVTIDSEDSEVKYTLDETITYYAEETELALSGTFRGAPQVPERASGGSWNNLSANAALSTVALGSGIYTFEVSARNHGSSEASLDVQVRNVDGAILSTAGQVKWDKAICSVDTVVGISVPEGATITIAETGGYTSNIDVDYVIVRRTGDLTEQISVNSTGASSYVTTYALDFSEVEGLTALVATAESENSIVLEKVTEVPVGTPIIVRGAPGETYDVPVGTRTEPLAVNLLSGSPTESKNAGDYSTTVYALKNTDGAFHPVAATVTIPAKVAYLVSSFSGSASAKAMVVLGEEETAVTAVEAAKETAGSRLYNAAGQQVGAGYKGLVIDENGKKYIK